MLDIHCHILYGVDDGARSFEESVDMLNAAKNAGITGIIATPHLRSRVPDEKCVAEAFERVGDEAAKLGIKLYRGYEAHYRMLAEVGMDELQKYCLAGTNALLLEFSFDILPPRWESFVVKLQRAGLNIIIAHPERYSPLQNDRSTIERMVEINCAMQIDADSLKKGLFSKERKCALDMLKNGQVSYIASDAHTAADYAAFAAAAKHKVELVPCEYLDSLQF